MGLKIAIPKETAAYEKRVAASPETVKKIIALGAEVTVQSGAGTDAAFTDNAYITAGASIANGFVDTVKGADIVLKVQAPDSGEIEKLPKGSLLIAMVLFSGLAQDSSSSGAGMPQTQQQQQQQQPASSLLLSSASSTSSISCSSSY